MSSKKKNAKKLLAPQVKTPDKGSIPVPPMPSPAIMQDVRRGMASQQSQTLLHSHEERHEVFSGPLPPPQVLAEYEKVGARDLVVKLALDANERQNKITDAKVRTSDFAIEKAKMQQKLNMTDQCIHGILLLLAFILCGVIIFAFLFSAIYFAMKGNNIWATAYGVAFLISVIGSVFGNRQKTPRKVEHR